jgi:hypothetical protein
MKAKTQPNKSKESAKRKQRLVRKAPAPMPKQRLGQKKVKTRPNEGKKQQLSEGKPKTRRNESNTRKTQGFRV